MTSVPPYPAVLLFGAPGVGKGTQGRILQGIPGFTHISSGDLFRNLDPNSDEGREAHECTSRGELVSDELTIRVFQRWLRDLVASGKHDPEKDLLVLDGIPRTVQQAADMDSLVNVLAVICFECADEEAMLRRIQHRAKIENRNDDLDEATIRHRFEVYHKETEPVLKHYSPDLIKRIDPLMTPAEVLRELLDIVIPIHPAKKCITRTSGSA
ncbi:MAG: adenylate kinase [Planctomycetaceae bacterium]